MTLTGRTKCTKKTRGTECASFSRKNNAVNLRPSRCGKPKKVPKFPFFSRRFRHKTTSIAPLSKRQKRDLVETCLFRCIACLTNILRQYFSKPRNNSISRKTYMNVQSGMTSSALVFSFSLFLETAFRPLILFRRRIWDNNSSAS